MHKYKKINWFWDAWCLFSVVGIWPRYIEPNLLSVTKISIPIPHLNKGLMGLKILQISDLHWNAHFSPTFKNKIIKKINSLVPDLIVFTGDFLTQAHLEDENSLLEFLKSLKAQIGCYAVLGNHDYANYVTVNAQGDYDVENSTSANHVLKGFKRLLNRVPPLTKKITERAKKTANHKGLIELLEKSSFKLLHNSCQLISLNDCQLNICGVGEYTLGRSLPKLAFSNYDENYPGIILAHNPDSIPELLNYPGHLILCGHTHGGQVNLPFIWDRFTRIENRQFKRGLKKIGQKYIYINRGVAGGLRFRWFSRPELTLFTLVNSCV